MIDPQTPRQPLTVHLPAELIEELQVLAREKQLSIDDVVLEACAAYTEPYSWQRDYKAWLAKNPREKRREFGIDGDDLDVPEPTEGGQ
jgi:hypothetical protein